MPVQLTCSCGKELRVPDELAGRRVKCPACGEPQLVPADAETPRPARKTAAASSAKTDEGVVRFRCECGKMMQARSAQIGKSTRCPSCEATVKIPDEEEARKALIRADRPLKKTSIRREEDEEDEAPRSRRGKARYDEDEDDRPRSRRDRYRDEEEDQDEDDWDDRRGGRRRPPRKSSTWIWVAALAGVLLLIGGGIGAYFLFAGSSMAPDLALVPGNAQGFVTIRVADIWNHDYTKTVLSQLKQKDPQMPDPATEVENYFGVAPADIERLTFVFGDMKQNLAWGIVATTKPYDRNKILGKLTGVQERKQGSKSYQVGSKGFEKLALYFHTDRIFLISNEKGLQHSLTSMEGKRAKGPLDSTLKKASGKHHIVGGMIAMPEIATLKRMLPPQAASFGSVLDFQSASLQVDFGKSTTDMELAAIFPDGGKAQEAKKAIDSGLALVKGLVPMLGAQGAQASQILDGTKVNQSGSEVTIKMSGPNGDPSQLVDAINSGVLGGRRKVVVPPNPGIRPGQPGQPGIQPGKPGFQPGQPGVQPGQPGRRPRRPRQF